MANEIPVKLAFQGDMSAIKRELKDLKTTLDSVVVDTKLTDSFGQVNTRMQEGVRLAAQLQGQLQAATTKTGNLKLDVLAKEFDRSGASLQKYVEELNYLSSQGYKNAGAAAQQLINQIQAAYEPINQLSGGISRVLNNLTQDIIKTFNYSLINKFTGAVRGAFYYAQNLDRSLNDIRIVTNLGVDQMAEFAKQANNAAMALGATTLEYTRGALIYYQQGLSGQDVIERTNATIKLANTSGEAAEQISSYMTGIWNNFDKGSKSVEYYADVISYLGAVTAASNADIAEGVQAFAATAETVGLSFEYATGALTTLVDKTQQSASTIGNSLKTIFARLSSVKLGETLEDGVDLTKYTSALETVGVSVLDANGNLKEMDEILDELGRQWVNLNNAQKVALAQTVGGVRQYNNLISLMDNYGYFKELVNDAYDSEGYLSKQNATYLESWAAASDQVRAAWQKIYDLLIDDQLIIKLTKGFADIVSGVGDLMNNLGGLKSLLPSIVSFFMYFMGNKLTTGIGNVVNTIKDFVTFNSATGGGGRAAALQAEANLYKPTDNITNKTPELDAAIKRQSDMSEEYVHSRQRMTQAERILREEELKHNKELIESLVDKERDIQLAQEKINVLKENYDNETQNSFSNVETALTNRVAMDTLAGTGEKLSGVQYIDAINSQLTNSVISGTKPGADLNNMFGERIAQILNPKEGTTKEQIDASAQALADEIRKAIAEKLENLDDKSITSSIEELRQQIFDSLTGYSGENRAGIEEAISKHKQVQTDNRQAYKEKETALDEINAKLGKTQNKKQRRSLNSQKSDLEREMRDLDKAHEEEEKTFAANKKLLQDVDKATEDFTNGIKSNTKAQIDNANATRGVMDVDKLQNEERTKLAHNLTYVAQAGMAMVSIFNTASGIMKTLGDESVSLGQKLTTVVGGLSSITFQVVSLTKSFTTMIDNGLFGPATKTALTAMQAGTGTFGEVVKAAGASVASGLSSMAAGIASFLTVAAPYLIILGAIAIALAAYWHETNKAKKESEEAAEAATQAASAFDEVKEKYEGLKSSIEDYKKAKDAIDELASGTEEWGKAIDESNDKIMDMIDKYPELAQYLQSTYENGKQVLSLRDGYEDALTEAKNNMGAARISKYASAMRSNEASYNVELAETARKTGSGSAWMQELIQAFSAVENWDNSFLEKNTEELSALTGLTETQCNVLKQNSDEIIKLNSSYNKMIAKESGYANTLYQGMLNDSDMTDAEKAAYAKLAGTQGSDFADMIDKIYESTYKDQVGGLTDAEVQRRYAEAMGYDARLTENKTGNKAVYYDQNGQQVATISDEVARRYLAAQDAYGQFNDNIIGELSSITSGQSAAGTKALTGFIGGGQGGLNNTYLSQTDIDSLLGSEVTITDEQAKEAGYESAEKFVEAYKEALEKYNQSGISADFDYGTEDLSKDDLEFLEEYTRRLMEINEASAKYYSSQEEFKSAMKDMATRMMNMGDALDDINKNIDDYRTSLTKAERGTEEYERALASVRKDMSKLLDMEPSSFSEEFLKSKKNLDDMEKAANGDVKAFTRLQEAAGKDIVQKAEIKTEGAKEKLLQFIDESEQFQGLEIGATLDTTQAGQAMAELYSQLLASGEMTAEQVNAALSAIGFEPNVKYVEMPLSQAAEMKQTAYQMGADGKMQAITITEETDMSQMVKVPVLNPKEIHYTKPNNIIQNQKPKGGGSGSKKETKDKKSDDTEKKRYEVINNKLEETEELLTEIAGKEDRAFGADKVGLMEKEMDALNTQLDQYNTKLAEANDWLEKDKKAMDAYGARYDANGVITNYDQIMDQQIAIYNAAVDRYNRSAQSDADKERFEQAEKAYEKFLKAYEQYNETLDLVGELEQNVLDTIYKIQDKALEIITTQVQLNVEVNDRDIELIEYLMKQLEDKAYSAADAIALLGKEAANSLDKIAGYQEGIADVLSDVNVAYDEQLQKRLQNGEIDAEEYNRLRQIGDAYAQQFLNGEISAEQYAELVHMDEAHMEKLKEYADAIKDETLKLQELRKEAYEKLGETLDQFNEDLDKQKNKIEKATSALENYRNIVDTFGKKNLGLDDDIFEQMSRAQLKAAQTAAGISKMAVEEAKRAMEELQAQVNAATSEEQKRLLQEQLDQATESYQDALDDWTGDLADAADAVAQVFDDAIDHIVDKFGDSVGGLFNNLGDLQEAFDQASTLDDQYLDDYERIHQLNKLNKKINDSIDNGATVKSRQLLLSLQDEINKKEAEGVELSEYDLDVYQRRYELYLAQIALEEAQRAKSTVRMSRDNEGNWSYVYVADQDALDKAQEDYENKLYEYAKLNEDYITNTQNTMLALEKEYQDALAGLDETDPDYERKLKDLQQYYNDRMAFYVQQLNNALDANKEVASYAEAEDWNVKQNFEDTLLGQLTGVVTAEEYGEIFDEAVADATKAAMEKYHNYLEDLDTTTADIQDMASTIAGAIEDVYNVSDEAETEANAIAETFKTAFESALKELDAFADSYNADIDSMSFATARLLALINKLNEIKSGQTSNTDMPLPDTAYSEEALKEVLGEDLYNSITNKGTYDNIYGLANRGSSAQDTILALESEYRDAIVGLADNIGANIDRMAEISAAGFGDLTSFLVDHTGKLEQQVTITANFPNVVNHTEIEEAFSNLVNMAAQFANRKN